MYVRAGSVLILSPLDHDDVIKWKHFPRYWPFVRRIHRSPVNSPHKGQWRGALMFSLICTRINDWVNNREAGDLRRHQAHCDVIVMQNGHHFADGIFKHIILKETGWIWIQILLKFVPMVPIHNKSALVQVLSWHRTSDKPLPEPMLTQLI